MTKTRISRNLLVCAVIMGVFQSGILLAASQIRPESTLKSAKVPTALSQQIQNNQFQR